MQDDVRKIGSTFIYSEEMSWYEFGPDHPFKPERAAKTYDLCTRYGVMNHPWMNILEPDAIDEDLLRLFHQSDYLYILSKASRGEISLETLVRGLGTEDNPIVQGIYEWSLKAAGGTHEALSRIMRGDTLIGFNPLGGFHHAMPDHASGFCYLNDIAVAIKDARRISKETRIAFVDLDAHHGNGVQQAFYTDREVLFISLHQTGRTIYPGSGSETEVGEGEGKGFTINFPLEPGTDDEIYDFALNEVVFPLVRSFSPDIIALKSARISSSRTPLFSLIA